MTFWSDMARFLSIMATLDEKTQDEIWANAGRAADVLLATWEDEHGGGFNGKARKPVQGAAIPNRRRSDENGSAARRHKQRRGKAKAKSGAGYAEGDPR